MPNIGDSAISADRIGDLAAQHRVATATADIDNYGLNLSRAEERWIVGLGDNIRRLAGVS